MYNQELFGNRVEGYYAAIGLSRTLSKTARVSLPPGGGPNPGNHFMHDYYKHFTNPEVRDVAATICAIAASNPGEWYSYIEGCLDLDFDTGGLDSVGHMAHELAYAAWKHSQYRGKRLLRIGDPIIDAEAEAKIRSGWLPDTWFGHPVKLLEIVTERSGQTEHGSYRVRFHTYKLFRGCPDGSRRNHIDS